MRFSKSHARPCLRGLIHTIQVSFRFVRSICDLARWHACAGLDSLRDNGLPGRTIGQCYQSLCDKRHITYTAAPPPCSCGLGNSLRFWSLPPRRRRFGCSALVARLSFMSDWVDKYGGEMGQLELELVSTLSTPCAAPPVTCLF